MMNAIASFKIRPYDPKKKYCGPSGRGRFARLLAWLVTETPFGVSINRCCWWHDELYRKGGTGIDRRIADAVFYSCIVARMKEKWWVPGWLGRAVAQKYYVAVRVFGSTEFTYTESNLFV